MQPARAGSFEPLALLTRRETRAQGYVLHSYENGSATPLRIAGYGLAVPLCEQDGLSVARLPLRVQNRDVGSVVFVFRAPQVPAHAMRPLKRLVRTLESIWSLYAPPERTIDLVTRITRQQAELADLKIADRA